MAEGSYISDHESFSPSSEKCGCRTPVAGVTVEGSVSWWNVVPFRSVSHSTLLTPRPGFEAFGPTLLSSNSAWNTRWLPDGCHAGCPLFFFSPGGACCGSQQVRQ